MCLWLLFAPVKTRRRYKEAVKERRRSGSIAIIWLAEVCEPDDRLHRRFLHSSISCPLGVRAFSTRAQVKEPRQYQLARSALVSVCLAPQCLYQEHITCLLGAPAEPIKFNALHVLCVTAARKPNRPAELNSSRQFDSRGPGYRAAAFVDQLHSVTS